MQFGMDESEIAKNSGDAIPREPEHLKLLGHKAKITMVGFHPIYTQIASSSEDATIKIWDYETGECEQTLREHTGMVNNFCFHPNGESMASCSKDMTIKLWKRKHGDDFKVYKTMQGHEHEISCVEYLKPNGDYVISCSRDQTIRIWDVVSGFLMITLNQHNEWVRRVCLNKEGSLMASCSKDETVIIWNMDKIKQNMQKSLTDQTEYIVTVIDDHEHVIDAIRFATEAACQTIQSADYSKIKLQVNQGDLNQTNNTSGEKTMMDDENEETINEHNESSMVT